MTFPLHPATIAALASGRELMDRVSAARREQQAMEITVTNEDEDIALVFNGEGMVERTVLPVDLFERYPADVLSEELTDLAGMGYDAVDAAVDQAIGTGGEGQRP